MLFVSAGLAAWALNSASDGAMTIGDLAARYARAASHKERLMLCVDAVDQGLIAPGMPIEHIDHMFGTRYAVTRSGERTRTGNGAVYFREVAPLAESTDTMVARPQRRQDGWRLVFQFADGMVTQYLFTDVNKGGQDVTRPTPETAPALITRFAAQYAAGKTERDRLVACIDAISSGLFYRWQPARNVDAVFGTEYAQAAAVEEARSPGKRALMEGEIILAPPAQRQGPTDTKMHKGWRFIVRYYQDGKIQSYHLTNVAPDKAEDGGYGSRQ
jgi:hypothetical protein